MRKTLTVVLTLAVILTACLLGGCFNAVRGSGVVEAKTYDFSGFTQVHISGAFEFEVVESASFAVTIKADDNLVDYVSVSQEADKLIVGMSTISIMGQPTLEVKVSMPTLSKINVAGASRGTVIGFTSNNKLDIILSGACSVTLENINSGDAAFIVSGASGVTGELACANIELNVSGASLVQLEGTGNNLDSRVSGASNVNFENFRVTNASMQIDGASSSIVNISGTLDADITGASRLEYLGEPTLGTINTGIASRISKK